MSCSLLGFLFMFCLVLLGLFVVVFCLFLLWVLLLFDLFPLLLLFYLTHTHTDIFR